MKFICVALFFVALAVGANSSSATYGGVNNTNILLSRETVIRFPINGQFITEVVHYPKNGQTNNRIISGVRILDNFKNTTGANPTLYSGGPGFTFTSVNLKSQLSRGINSTVEIWGR